MMKPFVLSLAIVSSVWMPWAHAEVTSVYQLTDLTSTDPVYHDVQLLVEDYQVGDETMDGRFRPNDPVKRGEFVQFLYTTLEALNMITAKSPNYTPFMIMPYDASSGRVASIQDVRDVNSTYPCYDSLHKLMTYYQVVLAQPNKMFQPNVVMTEADVAQMLVTLISYDKAPKANKPITRGELAHVLADTLTHYEHLNESP